MLGGPRLFDVRVRVVLQVRQVNLDLRLRAQNVGEVENGLVNVGREVATPVLRRKF